MGTTTISTIVFILSILSAIVTGGIKFLQNSQEGEKWVEELTKPNTQEEHFANESEEK